MQGAILPSSIWVASGQSNAESLIEQAGTLNCNGGQRGGIVATTQEVARALRGEGFGASEDGTGRGTPIVPVVQPMSVRRLTPRECERLQGFPDDYTDIKPKGKDTPDGPRYKALGNSMAVPVMRWIGERINAQENA